MKNHDKNLGKIAFSGLSAGLIRAIAPYADIVDPAVADVVVCAAGNKNIPPATATVDMQAGRPERFAQFLQRLARAAAEPALHVGDFYIGEYVFSPQDRKLTRGEIDIALTDRESDMLVYIARQRGRAVARDELLKNVWRYQEGVDTHTLETHIYRLRQKLSEGPALLLTEDDGYRLAPIAAL